MIKRRYKFYSTLASKKLRDYIKHQTPQHSSGITKATISAKDVVIQKFKMNKRFTEYIVLIFYFPFFLVPHIIVIGRTLRFY